MYLYVNFHLYVKFCRCFEIFFNRHIVAFFETSVLEVGHTLHYVIFTITVQCWSQSDLFYNYVFIGIRKTLTRKIPTNQTLLWWIPPGILPPKKFPPGNFPPMFLTIPTYVFQFFCLLMSPLILLLVKFDNPSLLWSTCWFWIFLSLKLLMRNVMLLFNQLDLNSSFSIWLLINWLICLFMWKQLLRVGLLYNIKVIEHTDRHNEEFSNVFLSKVLFVIMVQAEFFSMKCPPSPSP